MKNLVYSLLGLALVCSLTTSASAKDVTGKVMAVYHEPVTLNNKTLDKVSVSVNNCGTGQWETFSYSPGSVSDDNSLGFLYTQLANSARSVVSKNQYMNSVSGHVTLSVNEQNVIQKTNFWGYNWECGRDLDGGSAASVPGATPQPGASTTQPVAKPAKSPLGGIRRFGF